MPTPASITHSHQPCQKNCDDLLSPELSSLCVKIQFLAFAVLTACVSALFGAPFPVIATIFIIGALPLFFFDCSGGGEYIEPSPRTVTVINDAPPHHVISNAPQPVYVQPPPRAPISHSNNPSYYSNFDISSFWDNNSPQPVPIYNAHPQPQRYGLNRQNSSTVNQPNLSRSEVTDDNHLVFGGAKNNTNNNQQPPRYNSQSNLSNSEITNDNHIVYGAAKNNRTNSRLPRYRTSSNNVVQNQPPPSYGVNNNGSQLRWQHANSKNTNPSGNIVPGSDN